MKRYWLIAVLIAGTTGASDQAVVEQRIQRLQSGLVPRVLVRGETPDMKSLAQRMAETNVPGLSIAVIDNGRIEWARGFGVTREGGPPVTADTLFAAASISKPVFTLAVLQLVEKGKLDLDANINDYLKSWKLPENELTKQAPVTLRRLLSHSSGITRQSSWGYRPSAPVPTLIQILDGAPPANTPPVRITLVPGSQYSYSTSNYTIAQLALTEVTGVPLPKLMRKSVLAPLGMSRSTYEQPLPAARRAEIALPHDRDGKPVPGGPNTFPELAGGGLWTTPSDLARYAIGVQQILAGKKGGVIKEQTARAMLTPVIANRSLGLEVGGPPERKYFLHGGELLGYDCHLFAYTHGKGVVIMTNAERGSELVGEVFRTIAYLHQWPDFGPPERVLANVAPALFERYVGAYLLEKSEPLVIRKEGERLFGQVVGEPVVELFPSSEREFFAKRADVVVSFDVSPDGGTTAARFRMGEHERMGPRADEERARALLADAERIARRLAEQKPLAGSEPAVRKLLADLVAGKPDYDEMSPALAEQTRRLLPSIQQRLVNLGAVKSIAFLRVGSRGDDHFDIVFEKGTMRGELLLGEQGRIERAYFQGGAPINP